MHTKRFEVAVRDPRSWHADNTIAVCNVRIRVAISRDGFEGRGFIAEFGKRPPRHWIVVPLANLAFADADQTLWFTER